VKQAVNKSLFPCITDSRCYVGCQHSCKYYAGNNGVYEGCVFKPTPKIIHESVEDRNRAIYDYCIKHPSTAYYIVAGFFHVSEKIIYRVMKDIIPPKRNIKNPHLFAKRN
jgi:hypothetical protein